MALQDDQQLSSDALYLSDASVCDMKVGRIFRQSLAPVNSLSFSRNGEWLVSSADDDAIRLYDVRQGAHDPERQQVHSKKYGCDLARVTHSSVDSALTILVASKNGWDETIRYLSLHDQRYLRYFKGHRDAVCCIAMHPLDDAFLSASLDGTVRVWDLNAPQCQGVLRRRTGVPSMVAFNPDGSVFAVASSNNTVSLYARQGYERGPFLTFQVAHFKEIEWLAMEFSPNGNNLLLSCVDALFLYDSFDGNLLAVLRTDESLRMGAFSPDGQFVFAGTSRGCVAIWNTTRLSATTSGNSESNPSDDDDTTISISTTTTTTATTTTTMGSSSSASSSSSSSSFSSPILPLHKLPGHSGPVGVVAWNPVYSMFASACQNVYFWQ